MGLTATAVFFFFSFISKIVCKTEKVTQEVSHLFFSPSISSLVGWYIEIPSVKEFTYSILVDRIIHCTLLFQFLQNITELYIVYYYTIIIALYQKLYLQYTIPEGER